jgi:hypothetical protein
LLGKGMRTIDPRTNRPASESRAFGRRKDDRRSGDDRRDAAARPKTAFAWLSSTFAAHVLGQHRAEQPDPKNVRGAYGARPASRLRKDRERERFDRWI